MGAEIDAALVQLTERVEKLEADSHPPVDFASVVAELVRRGIFRQAVEHDRRVTELLTVIDREVALRRAAQGALERDRSLVAVGVTKLRAAVAARAWMRESRGSFEYDDPKFMEEFGGALDEIEQALEPLRKIAADWSNCPTSPDDIVAARACKSDPVT